jgi:RimJ/RimL family protein N-acetyltransferase
LASDGSKNGFFVRCVDFCRGRIDHLRIDTHRDNVVMQHLIDKNGFQRCGIIYLANGDPRIAYELI